MFCQQCGATIPDTVRFCTKCGAPVRGAVPPPQPAAAPIPPGEPAARPATGTAGRFSRTFRLICVLALIAAFGCGMLAGFLVGSAVTDEAEAVIVPLWATSTVRVDRNKGGHLYAAFTATASVDAKKLYVVIETRQNGTLLRADRSNEDGRVFADVGTGDGLRVKLFPEYDAFAPVDGAFVSADGQRYRKGGDVPLQTLLDGGLDSEEYLFYFYDGSTCVGQCALTIDFTKGG